MCLNGFSHSQNSSSRSQKVSFAHQVSSRNACLHQKLREILNGGDKYENIFLSSTFHLRLHSLSDVAIATVAPFPQLGEDGYQFLRSSLGDVHAECCDKMGAISVVVLYGYTLIGLLNLHSSKGCVDELLDGGKRIFRD